MRIYPRVNELMSKSRECATKCARESKPLHKVIPIRRKVFPFADDPDFSSPRWLNPDFARISNNKTIAKTRYSAATFADLEKVEKVSRWSDLIPVSLAPHFIKGKDSVLADSLSRPNQVQGAEWTLKQGVFLDLWKRWPVMLDLFATSLHH